MKAINIKKGYSNTKMPRSLSQIDISERQPCWYATLENGTSRKKAKWIVGVKKTNEEGAEYSFRLSRVGDVDDDKTWTNLTSADFAVEIINVFRESGKSGILKWIKEKK